MGFSAVSVVESLPANAGDVGSIPGSGRSLEKEMATHSSILAWKISRTDEAGGLQSMGSQRVGQDSETEQQEENELDMIEQLNNKTEDRIPSVLQLSLFSRADKDCN